MSPTTPDLERPIVILAVPRSGSQLLRMLLNAHHDVFVAAYSNLLGELANPQIEWERASAMLHYEFDETRRSNEDLSRFLRRLYYDFWTTSGEVAHLKKASFGTWGFVNYAVPRELQAIALTGLFPRARYVHIVRDGRNVVASWLSNWDVAALRMPVARREPAAVAELWVRWLAAAEAYRPLTLRLEDLHDPTRRTAVLTRLCAHCDLAPSAALSAYAAALPFVNAEKQSVTRWKSDLAGDTLRSLYAVSGFVAALRAHDYEV